MDEHDVDALLSGSAQDQWAKMVKDDSLPIFARMRALERTLGSLGFEGERELVRVARASMAFAACKVGMVQIMARCDMSSADRIAMMGGMVVADLADAKTCLLEGIDRLEAQGGEP